MKIMIKGSPWDLQFVDKIDEDDDLGLTKTYEKEIFIKKGMDRENTIDAVAHELTHAYLIECGFYMSTAESEEYAYFFGRCFGELAANHEKILNTLGGKKKKWKERI